MLEEINKDAKMRMNKAIESFKNELSKLRTGRAHPSLLEHIKVDYYGNLTPLNQVASITASDPQTLSVTPWDKSMIQPIEKAIINSDLGLNPATAGTVIRVPLPPLTEERRKELVKVVKGEAENARVAVRNIRRDANNDIKDLLKAKEIGEDEEHRAEDAIQKLTNSHIAQIDKILADKEKELLEI
jgi:ribosome recycling factor